jgi:AraC-like DNA-binding protein
MLPNTVFVGSTSSPRAANSDSAPSPLPLKDASVCSSVARSIVHAAEAVGVPRADLIRAARLSPDQLERREGRVPRSSIYRLCEQTVVLSGDAALGLHWAERLEGQPFDLVTDIILRSPTLRAGLQSLIQYLRLIEDDPSFEIKEHGDLVCVRGLRRPGVSAVVQRFVSEVVVLRFWRLVCDFGVRLRPVYASFEYSAPAYRSEYTRLFAGTERFDQTFTGLVFDRALLDAPSPHEDEDVHSVLRSVAERRMLRLTDNVPYAARARDVLVRHGSSRIDMEKIARSLGLSGRTLRRRLASEGIKYEQVVNEAMAIIAKQRLATSRLSIQEISAELGFAHSSGFHRAFKRLTGMTPVEFRRRVRTEELAEGLCG